MYARKFSPGLLVLALALLLAACAPAPAPVQAPVSPTAPPALAPTSAPTLVPAAAAPTEVPAAPKTAGSARADSMTVTDDLGRQVAVPAKVSRVVSMAPSATEILFAVGAGEQVVGVTKYCNYPAEAQKGREIVGGFTANSLSVEKILSLKPDVVFSSGSLQRPVIQALEGAQVPVVALEAKDLSGIYANIRLAGKITGHGAEADKLAQDLQRRGEAVQSVAKQIEDGKRVKVFYEVWDEPLMTAGPTSFIGQLISSAGGINIFADTGEQYPQINGEAVLERGPDVILAPDNHADALTPEKVTARPGWANVPAVKSNRIYIVNGDMISRAGPRAVEALESLARQLYPERYQ